MWRFRLIKEGDVDTTGIRQIALSATNLPQGNKEPKKQLTTTLRIVRDSAVSRAVKVLYDYRCQVCGLRIDTPAGFYAEGAHIRPLGAPHNGEDTVSNILCLCPNHHVMFDNFGFTLTDDLRLIGIAKVFNVHADHAISIDSVRYHREHRYIRENVTEPAPDGS